LYQKGGFTLNTPDNGNDSVFGSMIFKLILVLATFFNNYVDITMSTT